MMPKAISLVLSLDDVNAVLNVLGELPSKTGAWPLIQRIREQAESQVNAAAASVAAPAAASELKLEA